VAGCGTTVGSISNLSKDERIAELEARLDRLERAPSLRARGRSGQRLLLEWIDDVEIATRGTVPVNYRRS
jgi:hypothetical protein